MIIGISGKIGSGKDTVGSLIQFLIEYSKIVKNGYTTEQTIYQEYLDFIREHDIVYHSWEIKKFADKLKDIVCLLIGCTREQLEDQEFKNTELGEEWWTFDETAIKNWLLNSYSRDEIDNDPDVFLSNYKYSPYGIKKLTPRLLLQLLGTNCGRNIIHPDIWVNSLFSNYTHKSEYEADITKKGNPYRRQMSEESKWIITDMRFPNELKAVKDRGGITIKVNRSRVVYNTELEKSIQAREVLKNKYGIETSEYPEEVSIKDDSNLYLNGVLKSEYLEEYAELIKSYKNSSIKEHESETALDNAEFDYIIDNSGSIEDLILKVKEVLVKEKII